MPANCGVRWTTNVTSMIFAPSGPLGGPPGALLGRLRPSGAVWGPRVQTRGHLACLENLLAACRA
eukprot:2326162-Pyramimonas_sp.AAC.1